MPLIKPVLLTGATGFVGRAILAELVARSIPVEAVSRRDMTDSPGVRWLRADLLDPAARARLVERSRAATMIHAAWYVEHGAFWNAPVNALWQTSSLDLATRFLAGSGRRVVGLGTCAEYATQPACAAPWPETRAIAPDTPYGKAKAALHAQLEVLCGDIGASLVWVRLFHLFGPGEHAERFVPSMIGALAEGRRPEVRSAGLVRDFASTARVARCIVTLMESDAQGVFNIGSGTPLSLGALAQIIADASGTRIAPDLYHEPGPGIPAVQIPDLTRLTEATGLATERAEDSLALFVRDRMAARRQGG